MASEHSLWKKIVHKLYGIGSAVVILGALFKLNYWEGAATMLTIGMLTEFVLFILSSFDPMPHGEVDWTRVYPELAEAGEGGHISKAEKQKLREEAKRKAELEKLEKISAEAASKAKLEAETKSKAVHHTPVASMQMNDLSDQDMQSLKEGFGKLGQMAGRFAELGNAVDSSQAFTQKLNNACKAVDGLSDSYQKSSTTVDNASKYFADSVVKSSEQLKSNMGSASVKIHDELIASSQVVSGGIKFAAEKLTLAYKDVADKIADSSTVMGKANEMYASGATSIVKNLKILNDQYELHTKYNTDILKSVETSYSSVKKTSDNMLETAKSAVDLNTGINALSSSISKLNNVYGSMLTELNKK